MAAVYKTPRVSSTSFAGAHWKSFFSSSSNWCAVSFCQIRSAGLLEEYRTASYLHLLGFQLQEWQSSLKMGKLPAVLLTFVFLQHSLIDGLCKDVAVSQNQVIATHSVASGSHNFGEGNDVEVVVVKGQRPKLQREEVLG